MKKSATCPFCQINVYWPETEASCTRSDCRATADQKATIVHALNARIHQELVRISGGRGLDHDGVPIGTDGPSFQVTARLDSQNFSLIPCWSGLHAHLAYALATIEHPTWSVKLVSYMADTDNHGAEEGELLRQYRTAAGDAADGECDCGKGDYCPQYGRLGSPLPNQRVTILEGPDVLPDVIVATVRVDGPEGFGPVWVSRDREGSVWKRDLSQTTRLGQNVQDALNLAVDQLLIDAAQLDDGGRPTPEDAAMLDPGPIQRR